MRHEKLANLVTQIETDFPGVVTELATFPSGAAMLDVRWQDRLFVIAYTPSSGFGVDEVSEGEAFDTGYKFISRDFDEARKELYRLLKSIG